MPQKTALILIDHGSRRAESNDLLLGLVHSLREANRFDLVVGAHMDIEQPSLKSAIETCRSQGAERIVVVPFMLSPGRHSTEDIPEQARQGWPEGWGTQVVVAEPLGQHPLMMRAIFDRADEALGMQKGMIMGERLAHATSTLLVIDLQKKLLPHIEGAENIISASSYLIRAARELSIPILLTEQYPEGLGATDEKIAEALGADVQPISKTSFSCLDAPELSTQLDRERPQLILCGVEAHVCVLQTALQALEEGFSPFVVVDAIGSRKAGDYQAALHRMGQMGVSLVSAEMAVYELLREAGTAQFKALLPMLKDGPAKTRRSMGFHHVR